jgi:hypothetical protein
MVPGQLRKVLGRLRDEPPLWIGLGGLGAGGAALLTFGDTFWSDWSDDAHEFVDRGASILWLTLVFAQVAIWAGLQGPAWALAGQVSDGENKKSSIPGLILIAIYIGAVVYLASTLELEYPIPGHDVRLACLAIFGFAAIVPGVLAIWRVHRLSADLASRVGEKDWEAKLADTLTDERTEHVVPALQRLRSVLDSVLALLGVMLGAAVFAVAGFRNAVVSWYPAVPEGQPAQFDPAYVLFYGGALTLLLAVLYIPAFLSLRGLCQKVLENLIPIWRGDAEWEAKLVKRSNVAKQLKLDAAIGSSLTAGVWILAPLLTSAAGVLLPD